MNWWLAPFVTGMLIDIFPLSLTFCRVNSRLTRRTMTNERHQRTPELVIYMLVECFVMSRLQLGILTSYYCCITYIAINVTFVTYSSVHMYLPYLPTKEPH